MQKGYNHRLLGIEKNGTVKGKEENAELKKEESFGKGKGEETSKEKTPTKREGTSVYKEGSQ